MRGALAENARCPDCNQPGTEELEDHNGLVMNCTTDSCAIRQYYG